MYYVHFTKTQKDQVTFPMLPGTLQQFKHQTFKQLIWGQIIRLLIVFGLHLLNTLLQALNNTFITFKR